MTRQLSDAEVLAGLNTLRKGFGIENLGPLSRADHTLRRVVGISGGRGAAERRAGLRGYLRKLVGTWPPRMAALGREALALDGLGDERFGQRLRRTAAHLDAVPRTARRRFDEVLERVAKAAMVTASRSSHRAGGHATLEEGKDVRPGHALDSCGSVGGAALGLRTWAPPRHGPGPAHGQSSRGGS